MDAQAFIAEVLSYYALAQGREARLSTATERANVVSIAQTLGYKPRRATAASTQLVFRLKKTHDSEVVIPQGFVVRTARKEAPQSYSLVSAVEIAPGKQAAGATAEAASRRSQVADMRGVPNQALPLTFAPYLDGSISLHDANGQSWIEVDSFIDSKASDRHYTLTENSGGRAILTFGDGVLGATPLGRMDVVYKTGGGASGMVEADTLTVLERPILDVEGRPVEITCTNPEPSMGGADEESIESIRVRAPMSLRVSDRTVTREDFEINAMRVEGVARALMLTKDEDPSIEENAGRLCIVPKGGGQMSRDTRDAVSDIFRHQYPHCVTFQLSVETAAYCIVDVEVTATLVPVARGAADEVRQKIARALRACFALTQVDGQSNHFVDFGLNLYRSGARGRIPIDFGFNLRGPGDAQGVVAWSDVLGVVRAVPHVRKVDDLKLNGGHDVALSIDQFPVLGNVDVRFVGGATR